MQLTSRKQECAFGLRETGVCEYIALMPPRLIGECRKKGRVLLPRAPLIWRSNMIPIRYFLLLHERRESEAWVHLGCLLEFPGLRLHNKSVHRPSGCGYWGFGADLDRLVFSAP